MYPNQGIQSPALQESSPASTKTLSDRDMKSLKRSCRQFEAIFLQSMLKAMRKTIPDGGFFEKDTAHEIYQDMLDQEISNEMSRRQSIGLADQMYRQMEKHLTGSEKK
ncbi:MAG TPA: flagellar biosynthesis protein FlgJ [Desulfobulbus sp.]|nr:flagellar biosynthesis protein FlgJ [Desulfobulbus sp.]